jgi:hypothetical protein
MGMKSTARSLKDMVKGQILPSRNFVAFNSNKAL